MPVAVVVDFPGYAGPRFYDDDVVVEGEAGAAAAAADAASAAEGEGEASARAGSSRATCRFCPGPARPSTTRASRGPSAR